MSECDEKQVNMIRMIQIILSLSYLIECFDCSLIGSANKKRRANCSEVFAKIRRVSLFCLNVSSPWFRRVTAGNLGNKKWTLNNRAIELR